MKILSKILGPFTPLAGILILLLVWQIAFWVEVVDHVLLPSPWSMFVAVWQGMSGGQLLFDFFRTIERTALSIRYAGIIGIPRPRTAATISEDEFVQIKDHCLEVFQKLVRGT
ncbi:MAG: hypothetical protein HOF99_00260 [Rhodospirillaceae bacterium]|nr:hypothetical protein [Rhodospirillaceae bacterium]